MDNRISCSIGKTLFVILIGLAACARPPEPGDPLGGLTREQKEQFDRGREVAERVFAPEEGLGPLFNSPACGECHEEPAPGGSGDETEVHVSALRADKSCDPLADKGGPVIQQAATPALRQAAGIDSEPVPAEATGRATRTTPDLFGFGLLDAVPEAQILAYADPDDKDGDGISGRPNRFFDGRLGRFGRKALLPNLREFNAGAFVIEQGITNPEALNEETIGGGPIPPGVDPVPEPEIDQAALDAADAFVRFLAPPEPLRLSGQARRGRELFSRVGCAACHVPVLETGEHPVAALSRKKVAAFTDLLLHDMGCQQCHVPTLATGPAALPELADQPIHPFTDLLLHDMGPELADICLGLAAPSEFRTEPLMGLRLNARFLHDGRAETIEQAIELHGGEAAGSRGKFRSLSGEERAALLEFLKSL
jgi:CxxC motif-containing protein (DUF1111 family)